MERAHVEPLGAARLDFLDNAAGFKEADPVGDVGGGEQVVRHHQHCRAAIAHRGDQGVEVRRRARVEAGGRLVQQQHRHFAQQRNGDRHLLPHALGEPAEPLIPRALLQSRRRQRIGDDAPVLALVGQRQEIVGILYSGQMFVEGDVLRQIGDAPPCAIRIGARVHARHQHRAGLRAHEPQQRRQRGRLTRAVAAEQSGDAAGGYAQRQAVKHAMVAVG